MTACPRCLYDPAAVIRSEWNLVIPGTILSQNDLRANARGWHGKKYRDWKKSTQAAIKAATRKVPRAEGWRQGILVRHYGKGRRPYDYDNLVAGCKPLVDVLRDLGLIRDDNAKFWRGYYEQRRSEDGIDRIEITLQELEK